MIFHIVDVLYVGNTFDADALTINKGFWFQRQKN